MTRSEEELVVRTIRRPRGRVRLRKYVVTEEVQRTIPLRREEIRVEEEPISNEDAGRSTEDADVSSEDADVSSEHEIVLYKEIPVIEKRVVPAERVRVVKDVRAHEAQISERLRKERIDVETPDGER
jgi:stress response protein YsnF